MTPAQHPALAARLEAAGLFEADWYRRTYPDVDESELSPLEHFLNFGLSEGRAPGPRFSPADYLAANPDVAEAGGNALVHYLTWGQQEGRALARPDAWPEGPLPEGVPAWVTQGAPARPATGRLRVLYVLSVQSGGTPQTNQDLMQALEGEAECLVLRCSGRDLVLYFFHAGIYVPVARQRLAVPITARLHTSVEYDQIVAGWLQEYAVTLVHIRHLVWQGLGVISAAKQLGLPVVCSFHDYYSICPSLKLLDENLRFCAGRCTRSRGECQPELWPAEQFAALKHDEVYAWQQRFAGALALCDAYVTTTAAARDLILSIFPALDNGRFAVIPHGRDFTEIARLAVEPEAGVPLRVLVPGHIAVAKGAGVLQQLAGMAELSHVEWHVLGSVDGGLEGDWPASVVFHGTYRREAFHSHVAEIRPHLGAVLSLWPETWCHTLTELWAAGLPVLGFDIGAVGERLAATGAGWRVSPFTAEAVAEALDVATQPGEWQRAAECVTQWQRQGQVSCSQMAERYLEVYRQACPDMLPVLRRPVA
ncbi:glycosyltransferase [Halomonas halodenitrificans]|uniref:glycosyltransferase n=1 Tax=Halomonas halodenitrificans TaxID=28252 RepID=UPI0004857AFA|nr:glycosyltransferase [Halomonas halodenitrificans]